MRLKSSFFSVLFSFVFFTTFAQPEQSTFLALTDIHLKHNLFTPITYGEDTGEQLFASTLEAMTEVITQQSPKFILLLGDLPAHHDMPNINDNLSAVLTGFSQLPAIQKHHLPVFYIPGNNDSLIKNYGPFSNEGVNLFSLDKEHHSPMQQGWPALNAHPDCLEAPQQACTYTTTEPMPYDHAEDMAYAQSKGYYSAYPLGSQTPLRFIGLNSVIFSYRYTVDNDTKLNDAQQEMNWLARQLENAAAHQEAVYIGMHIPVGNDVFAHNADMWNDQLILNNGKTLRDTFLALMHQYRNNVRIVLAGHTHQNELRTLYADKALTQASVLGVIVPGITLQHHNNPGMQLFVYSPDYQLTDTKTYYTTPELTEWKQDSFVKDYQCAANVTMLECVNTNIIPEISTWLTLQQPIPGSRYKENFFVHAPRHQLKPYTSWTSILSSIKVGPSQ